MSVLYEDLLTVREGISWSDYRRVLKKRGDHSGPRIAYLDGTLEILHMCRDHGRTQGVINCLIVEWCMERSIKFDAFGSWTQQDEAESCGVEPDNCYIFGPNPSEATRPDLAVEVIWPPFSRIDKLEIYRRLAIQEVWVWRHGELTAHVLRDDTYEVSESRVLPGIDLQQIAGLMDQPTTSDAIRAYRGLLRA
jgi:Uma2 family endonuclease